MKINGRLLLILFAVALFVRVWNVNGQKPHRHAFPRSAATVNSGAVVAKNQAPGAVVRPAAEQRVFSPGRETSPLHREELWTVQTVPFKLPEGLAPGHYRLVSDTGRVARLMIDGESRTSGASADFVAIATETERWYLVRLKVEPTMGRPSFSTAWETRLPSVPDLSLSLNTPTTSRKFDFTGYVPAGAIDEAPVTDPTADKAAPASAADVPVQQAERPAPPELPSPL